MSLFDIGVNLSNHSFSADLPQVIARAHSAGVHMMMATGTSVASSQQVALLAKQFSNIVVTSGIHPHAAKTFNMSDWHLIEQLGQESNCKAIGETGLDYNRMYSSEKEQCASFVHHIELAKRLNKPLFLHCRDAWGPFMDILKEHDYPAGVVHCFTGDVTQMRTILEHGYHVGVTAWAWRQAERGDTTCMEALKYAPLECLHIETDAPYIYPVNAPRAAPAVKMKHGWRCEPMHLACVAQSLAELKQVSVAELSKKLLQNAHHLFGVVGLSEALESSNDPSCM